MIAFLEEVFGAQRLRVYDLPNGSVLHAEVRIGDTVAMLGEAGGEWTPAPSHVHVYVEDADAIYHRAVAAGATSLQEPARREGDPDRRGGFQDPGGNTWWVGTQVG